jgi:hypothetical protein
MMSRRRILVSVAGIAMASTACMAYPSNPWFSQQQAPTPELTPTLGATEFAPATQGAGYEREEGPRVSVYADVETSAGSRLVRANFHLDDDAYVLVGHIDADGILRIEFPDTPLDNGFTRGHASYSTAQFFAGFSGQYRARFSTGLYHDGTASRDSYDGGLGYLFVIASWQPLHFEKFSTGGQWDSFEVTDVNYAKDPRPAVYELASLLAGTNPESYTVRFANVLDTQSSSLTRSTLFADNSFGAQLCSGPGYGYNFGFASSPFAFSAFSPVVTYGYGEPFWYRGSQYLYSSADDCYYRNSAFGQPFGNGYGYPGYYGWTVAQTPTSQNPGTAAPRLIGIDRIRPPVSPQGAPMRLAPTNGTDVGATNTSKMSLAPETTSPQYRTRGLVAHEDPAGTEEIAPRSPSSYRHANDAGSQAGSTYQSTVIRGGNDSRGQSGQTGQNNNSSGRAPVVNSPRTDSHNDSPRAAPQPRAEAPHYSQPSSPPPMRVEAPRSEPARSAPAAPAAPASSSSSSSSSSGKPPSKN